MLFNSWAFWIFLPLVVFTYLRLGRRSQNLLLLASSYFFYAWWDWRFLGLLGLSTAVDFVVGLKLDARRNQSDEFILTAARRKRLLVLSLIVNLGVLGFFKYFGFFEENLIALLDRLFGLEVSPSRLDVILPVGISFYTFQSMSYTIDVYGGRLRATKSLVEFATFVAFFPQLVAGPIVRAKELLPQLAAERRYDVDRFGGGSALILWGLFKKVVVADNLAPLVDATFGADPSGLTGGMVLLATYAFAFQIYCDFSGYTDIARGCAKLMGFEFPLNFNLPYTALNPSDFWRRWHISLSGWLRDYLYVPLGGNRGSRARTYFNLMATMLLGGLWHGARWNFVLWGFYQGLLLVLWRFASPRLLAIPFLAKASGNIVVVLLQWFVFFHLVCFGWLIFRAQGLDQIYTMVTALSSIFDLSADIAWRVAFFSSPLILIQLIQHTSKRLEFWLDLPAPARGFIYAFWLIGVTLLGRFDGNEFIYFQF